VGEQYRDRYQVVEKVGEGAFAQVFRAKELAGGRECALKVLKDPYLSVKEVVERFQREVFAVASISSPHVVALHDFGISDDDFCIVMEYVEGPSLRDVMRPGPWPASDLRVVIAHIAHALAAAHQKGIVHRDLKPENVLLVRQGAAWQAKVLDFGFAKLPELERTLGLEPLTRKGHTFGTPHYMAPEQIQGQAVDARTDVYALGVIAYEMLADRRPFEGVDPRAVMRAVLDTAAPPIEALHPTMAGRTGPVNRFLQHALAKSPDDRPATVHQFFAEFCAAIDHAGASAATGGASLDSLERCSTAPIHIGGGVEDATIVDVPLAYDPLGTPLATPLATPLGTPLATPLGTPLATPLATPLGTPLRTPAFGSRTAQWMRSGYHPSLSVPPLTGGLRERWRGIAIGALCVVIAVAAFLLGRLSR
jgi:serine/threonine protein kinase